MLSPPLFDDGSMRVTNPHRSTVVFMMTPEESLEQEEDQPREYGFLPGPPGSRIRRKLKKKFGRGRGDRYPEEPDPRRMYAGEDMDYESEDEDYGSVDEDYGSEDEETFSDRMYAGEKEYRMVYEGKRRGEDSKRRPSLYEPLESGDDYPDQGLGRLVGTKACNESRSDERKKVIADSHRALRAKYAASRAVNSRMSERSAAAVNPVSMKASVADEIVRAPNKVIVVSEKLFNRFQHKHYNRSDDMINKFKNNAIEHMRGLLGFDFSRMRNPEVEQKGSVMVIGNKVRMAPYILGSKGSAQIEVTETKGFPSIKKNDQILDSGYVLSVISDEGVTVHGKYGGKKGKPLGKGQSFYYGEMLVKTPRNVRKPEWFRTASLTPSMITEKNTSRAEMEVRRTSLFEPNFEDGKTYEGKVTRVLKIERLTDAQGKVAKKVNSIYEINF